MNNTSASTIGSRQDLDSSKNSPSRMEGVTLCSAFMLTFVLVVAGNLITIILFAKNKYIRKKNLFLPINMAFADLFLGAVGLPMYIYDVGFYFQLWTSRIGNLSSNNRLYIFFLAFDTFFSQASIISAAFISCERFYAMYWPFKHRTLSTRTYRILIIIVWIITLFISAIWTGSNLLLSTKHTMFVWGLYTLILVLIMCGCYMGIWRKFQSGSVATSHQQNRDLQNKRLTKTLLFVSGLSLLAWLPLIISNFLIFVCLLPVQFKFYFMVNLINYFNSFVNPVVYALRIVEFRQALTTRCFLGREPAMNTSLAEVRSETRGKTDFIYELAFEQVVMDIKL